MKIIWFMKWVVGNVGSRQAGRCCCCEREGGRWRRGRRDSGMKVERERPLASQSRVWGIIIAERCILNWPRPFGGFPTHLRADSTHPSSLAHHHSTRYNCNKPGSYSNTPHLPYISILFPGGRKITGEARNPLKIREGSIM